MRSFRQYIFGYRRVQKTKWGMRPLQCYETNTLNNVYLLSKDSQKSSPDRKNTYISEHTLKRMPIKVACTITGTSIVSVHLASNWRRAWVNDHWELGQNTEIIIIIIVVVGSGIFFQPFFLFCFSYFRWRLVCLLFSDVTDFGLFFIFLGVCVQFRCK